VEDGQRLFREHWQTLWFHHDAVRPLRPNDQAQQPGRPGATWRRAGPCGAARSAAAPCSAPGLPPPLPPDALDQQPRLDGPVPLDREARSLEHAPDAVPDLDPLRVLPANRPECEPQVTALHDPLKVLAVVEAVPVN